MYVIKNGQKFMMSATDFHYEVDGYQYWTWEDREPDVIKTFHECYRKRPDGYYEEVKMPRAFYNHSPYSLVPENAFREYIRDLTVWIQTKSFDEYQQNPTGGFVDVSQWSMEDIRRMGHAD
jgi:hypothetical protein